MFTTNYDKFYKDACVPAFGRTWSFENFPLNDQIENAFLQFEEITNTNVALLKKNNIQEVPINCYLSGCIGIGKSSLAISAQRRYFENGIASLYILFPELVALHARMRRFNYVPTPKEEALQDLINEVPTLTIDDVGVENADKYTILALYMVVEHRRVRGYVTNIVSNNTIDELYAIWQSSARQNEDMTTNAERIVSRIHGSYRRFEIIGESLRS